MLSSRTSRGAQNLSFVAGLGCIIMAIPPALIGALIWITEWFRSVGSSHRVLLLTVMSTSSPCNWSVSLIIKLDSRHRVECRSHSRSASLEFGATVNCESCASTAWWRHWQLPITYPEDRQTESFRYSHEKHLKERLPEILIGVWQTTIRGGMEPRQVWIWNSISTTTSFRAYSCRSNIDGCSSCLPVLNTKVGDVHRVGSCFGGGYVFRRLLGLVMSNKSLFEWLF